MNKSNEQMVIVEIEHIENCRRFLTQTPKFESPTTAKIVKLHNKTFDSFDNYKQNGHKMMYETTFLIPYALAVILLTNLCVST